MRMDMHLSMAEYRLLYLMFAFVAGVTHEYIVSSFIQNIEAETKWPPFYRRHIQMLFLEWEYMEFDYNFNNICS